MEPIYREFEFELRSAEDGDGLTMEGYAAVFDSPTRITGWEGDFTETIQRGAFKRSLNARYPVLMFNHGKHPHIGDMPIGVIQSAREDDHGLFIRARLAANDLVAPVREAISMGAISGMSFRFEPIHDKWSKDRKSRTLTEVRVAELGPVVFPAYADTQVSVRALETYRALLEPELRKELASLFARDAEDVEALADELVPEDTSPVDSPAPEQGPASDATPASMSKRDRLTVAARLKGIVHE